MALPVRARTACDSDVCARCADRGPTCCHSPEGVALAPLTDRDVARIARHVGRAPETFVVTRTVDEEERQAWVEDDFAVDAWVSADGTLRNLAIVDGRCVFLGDSGCTLPRAVRPAECLRFPFVRRRGRRLEADPGGPCLACEEAGDVEELLQLMGLDRRILAAIERELSAEAKRNAR